MMKGSILQNQLIFSLLVEECFYFLLLSCRHDAKKVNKLTGEFLLTDLCVNDKILKFLGQSAFWESSVNFNFSNLDFNNRHCFPL